METIIQLTHMTKSFSLFLNHSSSVKDTVNKFSNLVRVMSIYSHFDYALNENYLKNLELFEDLNNKIYNNILRENIPITSLALYVKSLISLN